MKVRILYAIAILAMITGGAAWPQTDSVLVRDILHKADSVTTLQDTLLSHTKYKFREDEIFNEVDDKGRLKNSDTTVSIVTMDRNKEISREIISSTKTPEKKGGKQEAGAQFSLSADNPDYRFSLTNTDDSSYTIAMIPRMMPPKKGLASGTLLVDRNNYYIKKIDFEVPKPEGALKEFSSQMTFEPQEGGLVVMTEMQMKGFVKAFLGVFKMRFSGEIRHSNFEIIK